MYVCMYTEGMMWSQFFSLFHKPLNPSLSPDTKSQNQIFVSHRYSVLMEVFKHFPKYQIMFRHPVLTHAG